MNINTVHITGNLTEDPERRYTPSGKAVVSASIANNEHYTDAQGEEKKVTTFVNLKVFWRREGAERGTRIAWLEEGLKPSPKLALFFCQMACSVEDGHDQYYYYDKGLEPPKRIQS